MIGLLTGAALGVIATGAGVVAARPYRTRAATPEELRILRAGLARWRGYRLPNGQAQTQRLQPRQFDLQQLAIGTKVELEHTRDPAVALEIAMVHLAEHRLYYAALEAAEARLRR